MNNFLLRMLGVSKRFGAVQALDNVSISVRKGTVHALIGENGAGKSTLMKILSGSLQPDDGDMLISGQTYKPAGPKEARDAGVSMIYQELTLAPHLTVEENITLGAEQQKFGVLQHQWKRASEALALLGHTGIDLKMPLNRLSIGQQQLVEIARSLLLQSHIIIMDEPTSSLSGEDTRNLFKAINRLKDQGITIIYISHFLEEIQEIADEYTILRDGETVSTGKMQDTTLQNIVTDMVGRTLDEMFPKTDHDIGDVIFSAHNISNHPRVKNVSFDVRAGEILGIAGLIGAGRTETLRSIFGLDGGVTGTIEIGGRTINLQQGIHPGAALQLGLSMVSENRKDEGLAIDLPILDNISLSSLKNFATAVGILDLKTERAATIEKAENVSIKYSTISDAASSLSGGNQQKIVLARILLENNKILLLDEPTRGIDVRSKVEIYQLIGSLASKGFSIILVSSYLPELFGVCDTLAVMYRGRISPKKPIYKWSEESVMQWATTGK